MHDDAIRGELLFTPKDTLSVRAVADWTDYNSTCCTQVYVRVAPTLKPAAQQYAALAAGAIAGGYKPASLNPYDRVTDVDAPIGADTSEGGLAVTADWKAARRDIHVDQRCALLELGRGKRS